MSGLSITVAYQRMSEDEPLSVASINAQWASLSLQLTGVIGAALIPDHAITFPKLHPTVIAGAPPVIGTILGGDQVMIDRGGVLYRATTTQLLATGLSFDGSEHNWTKAFYVYGEKPDGITRVKATVLDHARDLIIGQDTQLNLPSNVEILADRLFIYDNSIAGAVNKNAKVAPSALVRAVTDRFIVTGGNSTAYTAADPYGVTALVAGTRLMLKLHVAVGSTPTLTLGGLAAKPLQKSGALPVVAGDYLINQIVEVIYDDASGGAWIILTPPSSLSAGIAKAWVTFDGRATWVDSTPPGTPDATADTLTSIAYNSWANGQLVWLRPGAGAASGLITATPYYVRKQASPNVIKLFRKKADALSGVGVWVNIVAGDTVILSRFTTPNILASYGVDGVIPTTDNFAPANPFFYVDFTNDQPDANYSIQITSGTGLGPFICGINQWYPVADNEGDGTAGTLAPRVIPGVAGFDIYALDQIGEDAAAAQRICVTVHGNP